MTTIYNRKEFNARTKPITDHLGLDIVSDTRLGIFLSHRLPELIQYCNKNPQYHIISVLPKSTTKINRPIEGAACYLLGEGDADPELIYSASMNQNQFETLQIYKF